MLDNYFNSHDNSFTLLQGNNNEVLKTLNKPVDMVFADPPYFLSNGGLTVENGKIKSVNKGSWDQTSLDIDVYNFKWLSEVRKIMKPRATIWISGTFHNIFSIHKILEKLNFKILNVITWAKTNPPPNFSKKYFTHSTEFIIWARKEKTISHYYNYELMHFLNSGRQMKDVWRLPAIAKFEKICGKHPTQKPLSLLSRIILSSTQRGDLCLDPFTGSSTTGIAANIFNRKFIGIDLSDEYLNISLRRKKELDLKGKLYFLDKIYGIREHVNTLDASKFTW